MDSKQAHHKRITTILEAMNSELLEDAQCLFGGGTAIAMQINNFRLSTDIDFICSNREGYRKLRGLIGQLSSTGLSPLFDRPISQLRETRADRYGIRSVLEVEGTPVKFEIVREDRISLDASFNRLHGVPMLSRIDPYAEKLLANSDRWADSSVLSRDIIDLAIMIRTWGDIPGEALDKARAAYGEAPIKELMSASSMLIQHETYRRRCFSNLQIEPLVQDSLIVTLQDLSEGGLSDSLYLDDEEPEPGPSF